MSNEITIITPKTLSEAKQLADTLAGARTIPEALQKSPADCMAIVLAGAELGLAPMQSIRALVLIKGKPTLSADAMGALVKSRRDVCQYLLLKASDATRATYETQRLGDPAPTTMSFTIDEAKAAGLAGNDNWRKFPAAMLRARALSAICRAVYPDLLLGVYDPDELAPEPRDVTPPRASPPVIESTATVMDTKATEMNARGKLLDLVLAANTVEQLNSLVPQMQALKMAPNDALRLRWGARRDELTKRDSSAATPETYAPQHIETEAVPA